MNCPNCHSQQAEDAKFCNQCGTKMPMLRELKAQAFQDWITEFLKMGFVDSFREINKSPNQYTWWSYRANARVKNLGWRIDYHVISEELNTSLNGAKILSKAIHSDHCPILIDIDF